MNGILHASRSEVIWWAHIYFYNLDPTANSQILVRVRHFPSVRVTRIRYSEVNHARTELEEL